MPEMTPDEVAEELLARAEEEAEGYDPNAPMLPFHKDALSIRERWVLGGNRSGKTFAGAQEAAWWATGRHPYVQVPHPNHGLIASLDFNTSRAITESLMNRLIPERMVKRKVRQNNNTIQINLFDGSTIDFKACEQGWEKFQGGGYDWAWIDEEPPDERIYSEIKMRVRAGRTLNIWGTMTPLNGYDWHYHRVFRRQGKHLKVYAASMMDNKHLLVEELERIRSEIPEREYQSRVFGLYADFTGLPWFSREALQYYESVARDPIEGRIRMDGDKPRFERDLGGELKMWQPPSLDGSYVIGADVASERGPNKSVAAVWDRDRHEKVAMWYGNVAPVRFGQILDELGKFYNLALLIPEANNHGISVVDELRRLGYPVIYRTRTFGREEEVDSDRLGWLTNVASRPLMLNSLANVIHKRSVKLWCRISLDQYRTFIVDADGKPAAKQGCDDDTVMADAIALQGFRVIASSADESGEKIKHRRRVYDPLTGRLLSVG